MGATTMQGWVEDYLGLRRRLGFTLHIEGGELQRFGRFADETGHVGAVTTALALRWATLPQDAHPVYHARRLALVRRFAQHRLSLDPTTEVPAVGLLGPCYRRRVPYIYRPDEIAALLRVAGTLGPVGGLRPYTFVTLFGLLAATGIRVGEALALTTRQVDLDAEVLTVPGRKSPRARVVPLHPTAAGALRTYAARRDHHRYRRAPQGDAFFRTEWGAAPVYHGVLCTFMALRHRLGWSRGPSGRYPRLHDLRHTFAVRRVLQWYAEGVDVDRHIGALSAYLGHVKVSDTYWYLTAVPELLQMAGARLEKAAAQEVP